MEVVVVWLVISSCWEEYRVARARLQMCVYCLRSQDTSSPLYTNTSPCRYIQMDTRQQYAFLSSHRFKVLFLRAFITLTTDYIYKFKKRVLFNVPASYHDANCNVHPWPSGVCIHFPLDGWRLVTRHSAASSLSLTSAHFNHNICFTIKHEPLHCIRRFLTEVGVLNPLALWSVEWFGGKPEELCPHLENVFRLNLTSISLYLPSQFVFLSRQHNIGRQ